MPFRRPAIAAVLCMLTAAGPWSARSAFAYSDLHPAVLKLSEVPSYFDRTLTHVYTAPAAFLKVAVAMGSGNGLTCSAPSSVLVGKYRQAMIQGIGHTAEGTQSMRVCSYLYATTATAHRAFLDQARSAKFQASLYSAKPVASRVGAESQAYAGTELEAMAFRGRQCGGHHLLQRLR